MKNNIFKMCFNIIKTTCINVGSFISDNYVLLTNLLLSILPAAIAYTYTKRIDLTSVIFLIQNFILFVKKFMEIIKNEKDGFPVLNKRLTVKRNDEITIRQGCLQEAIIYLSQVEDYTERCGYIKK